MRPADPRPPDAVRPASRAPLRRLYRWVLSWAHHPAGTWMLALFAFLDSSVFPIPPLFLQVALSVERPRRSWWYATVDLAASVAGAVLGYLIGRFLMESVGSWVVETWSSRERFAAATKGLHENAFEIVLIYSFLPFPYKLITIGAGAIGAPLEALLAASLIGRGLRFYLLAAVCRFQGDRAREFIDRHLHAILAAIALFVAAVLLVLRVAFKPA